MFRPCIDLRDGKVVQIVGGTLSDNPAAVRTNFISEKSASWFAELYRRDGLRGGHVIMLGGANKPLTRPSATLSPSDGERDGVRGNEQVARAALETFPGGLQIGGGINLDNARGWLDAGASHVIVTSWVFREGPIDFERLKKLVAAIGKEKLVLDLSCRKRALSSSSPRDEGAGRGSRRGESENKPPLPGPLLHPMEEREKSRDSDYFVVTDRWQKWTDVKLSRESLQTLAQYCTEFLIHAVDVEGLCRGIDRELVEKLAEWSPIPTTYAGGAKSLADLEEVTRIGRGKIDLTIGSALDIFGGSGVRYEEVVAFNRRQTG